MSVVVGPLVLGAEPDAVPRARRFVDGALRDHYRQRVEPAEFGEFTADARLVIAELATNALLHAGPPVTVRLVLNDDVCRVEVQDHSSAPPVPALASPGAMTGRGLAVVDMLASRWGVQATAGNGKVVWAELRASRDQSSRDQSARRAAADDASATDDTDDTAGGAAGGAGRDAEHWDIDRVLAQWADEAENEPQFTVTVGDVPTDLLLAAKSHIDNLVREFTLMASGAASGYARTPPPHLHQLIDVIVNRFGPARQAMKAQAVAAARRGDARTVLTLTLPASAADAGAQYLDALDDADSYARASRLLTLETPPQHRVFRRWYVESLITQLRYAAARQPPPPLRSLEQHLLEEIEMVATAQWASERAARLQALTAALAGALTLDDVAAIVVGEAVTALGAGAGSLLTLAGEHFAVPGAVGYSEELLDALRAESPDADLPAAVAIRTGEPVWLESRQDRDIRFPGLRGFEPGTSSLCAVPLRLGERALGALRFSFPEPRLFDAHERQFLLTFAAQTAQALDRVLAVAAAGRASERLALLAEASSVLAAGLDIDAAFRALADVLVPRMADWASVHLRKGGEVRLAAVAAADPGQLSSAQRLQALPVALDAPHGLGQVLRVGDGELLSSVSEDVLVATAGTDEHLQLARDLALCSVVTVPMTGRTGLFGAIQLCYGESGRRYDQDDLRLLNDLAARAAVAADNAWAYARQTGRRARGEAALRRSEERFRLLVDSATDAMFMLDPQGRVLTWNAGAQRVQGYEADEVIGEHFRRFYPPDARAWHRPEHALADAAGEGRHAEQGWRVRKDGTHFWAHVVITALRDAQDDLIAFGHVTREAPAQAP